MAAQLPRPGVEVLQVIRTTTPSVVTPTLVPCIVGVARQVVDLLVPDGSGTQVLNGDAVISLPAFFDAKAAVGSPAVYTGLDALSLVFSVNHGANVTAVFADTLATGLTPASVVFKVNAALAAAGVTSAVAEVLGTTSWRLRTVGVGEFQSIEIKSTSSPAVLTTFGFGAGRTASGISNYGQLEEPIPATNFPDPRGNLTELTIEANSARLFLAMSSNNFIEQLRTEAFLRKGAVDSAAVLTGTNALTGLTLPGDLSTLTLIVSVDNGPDQTVTFQAGDTSPTLVVARVNSETTGLVAEQTVGTNFLRLTSDNGGADSKLQIKAGTANTALGFTTNQSSVGQSIEVIDDGNGDSFSPLMRFLGYDFTAVGTAAVLTGNVNVSTLAYPGDLAGKTLELSDGQQVQTVTFSSAIANAAAVLSEINAVLGTAAGGRLTASLSTNFLRLTHSRTGGSDSFIWVKGGTAVTTLGLTADSRAYGDLGHVEPGDELFIDGVSFGAVSQVAPGGQTSVLKLSEQLPLTLSGGKNWYVIAKNLTGVGSDRPLPNLMVDANKTAVLKPNLLRDTTGAAVHPSQGRAPVYLQYTAIRKDLTALANQASLIRIDSQTQLEEVMSPISAQNPLALGMFFALVNAPGVQITGLGVDAVSADAPFGTPEAYTRAAELLEAFEVYALAPLTHDQTVAQIFKTHTQFMSEPAQKGERITLFNSEQPANALDVLVGSGADGNSIGSSGLQFDTGIPNLSALVLNKGVSPVGTIPATAGLFLDIASDAKRYSISGISGSVITIRTSFAGGDNDDGFYSTTALNAPPLPSLLISEAFAVRVRGAALVTSVGSPDKQKIAETYAALSQSFGDRRFWHTAPDTAAATLEGLEQQVEGFYMNAAIAGMIAQQPPQQSFTNFPMAGFTRVLGSNDFFSETQMNIMAAGGTYLIVQDAPSAPLISRMALTTDLTSVETRTDSITKVVDFTAKFLRRSLKNFIGRFNITQAFLDQLGTVIGGVGGFLVENGVLVGFNLNNIIQDEDAPDTVLVDVLIDPPYPCNYIRVTLVI